MADKIVYIYIIHITYNGMISLLPYKIANLEERSCFGSINFDVDLSQWLLGLI